MTNAEDKIDPEDTQEYLEQVGLAVEFRDSTGKLQLSLHKDTEIAHQNAVRHHGVLHDIFIRRIKPADPK